MYCSRNKAISIRNISVKKYIKNSTVKNAILRIIRFYAIILFIPKNKLKIVKLEIREII